MNYKSETTNYKKGEKIMKKIIMVVVTMMALVATLTGCSNPLKKMTNMLQCQ